jgi:hypothetical protein
LEARIRKVSRGVIGTAIDASRLADGVVPVSWKILEHNDGAVIQLIFAGSTETDIEVGGIVEGQPALFHVKPSRGSASPAVVLARERKARLVVIALLLASSTLALLVQISARLVRRTRKRSLAGHEPGENSKTTFWPFVLIVCMALFMLWQELRQPGPPFGF